MVIGELDSGVLGVSSGVGAVLGGEGAGFDGLRLLLRGHPVDDLGEFLPGILGSIGVDSCGFDVLYVTDSLWK